MSPRSNRRSPARCLRCQRPIIWLAHRGSRWRFDPTPIDPRTHAGPPAFPVEGNTAWRLRHLVEDLMGRRKTSQPDAMAEAYDMPWHTLHTCKQGETTP